MLQPQSIYALALGDAWRGSIEKANAWAVPLGGLAIGGVAWLMGIRLTVPDDPAGAALFALACLGAAWIFLFLWRYLDAIHGRHAKALATIATHEDLMRPKLTAEIKEIAWPKEGPPKIIEYKLDIINMSSTTLKNCYAKILSLTNASGQESAHVGVYFKAAEINGNQSHFDIEPHSFARVNIAGINCTIGNSPVIMNYVAGNSGIPRDRFPHRLEIAIGADNIPYPHRFIFNMNIEENGLLCIQVPG